MIVKNDLAEIPRLGEFISEFSRRCGLAPSLEGDLSLVLEEVVINVMKHGYRDRAEHEIEIRLTGNGDGVVMQVKDDGIEFNPLTAPETRIDAPIEQREPGKLGVFFVRRMMDHLDYRREGSKNVLIMRKYT